MEIAGLIFDFLVIACLGCAIFYAVILHRDMRQVLAQKAELEKMMLQAGQKIQTAERNFKTIQLAAQESNSDLEDNILKARELVNEMNFILEAGESLARKLTDNAERRSMPGLADMPVMPSMPEAPREEGHALSRAQQQLLARMGARK